MGAMAITKDGRTLYATTAADIYPAPKSGVYVSDIKSDTIVSYIPKQASPLFYGFEDAALSSDETKLYLVEPKGEQALSFLDTSSLFCNHSQVWGNFLKNRLLYC